jgi:hypothetical protein
VHGPALQEVVEERLRADPQLQPEVLQTLTEIGPKLGILVKMAKGDVVTGLDAENVNHGDVRVVMDVREGTEVIGAKVENLG